MEPAQNTPAARVDRRIVRAAPAVAERITVSLIEQALENLAHLQQLRRGMSRTDIVNRALTLTDFVETRIAEGYDILVRNPADGSTEKILLL